MSFISSASGQVAVAVGFLTRDPSLIWNTATHNAFYPTILSCMWGGGRRRGGDVRVGGLSNHVISSLWGKGAGKGL